MATNYTQVPNAITKENADTNDPEQVISTQSTAPIFNFPLTLGHTAGEDNSPFMQINAYEFKRGINSIIDPAKKFAVRLPLPGNLSSGYSGNYEQFTVNPVTGALNDITTQEFTDATSTIQEGVAGGASVFLSKSMGAGAGVLGKVVTNGIANRIYQGLIDANTRNIISAATGIAFNPRTEVAFNGMNLRTHSYSFNCVPRNAEEADELQAIIRALRIAVHPRELDSNKIFLKYPYEFTIGFYNSNAEPVRAIPFVPDCFLTSFNVTYNEGIPGRLHADNSPISYRLTFEFTESQALTRDDIEAFDKLQYGDNGVYIR